MMLLDWLKYLIIFIYLIWNLIAKVTSKTFNNLWLHEISQHCWELNLLLFYFLSWTIVTFLNVFLVSDLLCHWLLKTILFLFLNLTISQHQINKVFLFKPWFSTLLTDYFIGLLAFKYITKLTPRNYIQETPSKLNCVLLETIFELKRRYIFYVNGTDGCALRFKQLSK